MDALVVVESVFGNTRRIAEAVAEGLGRRVHARVVDVSEVADAVEGADLLVVGGPTQAFGMTRPATRRSAAEQAGVGAVAAEVGLREWLETLAGAGPGRLAAAFDTRADHPRMPGSAAAGAARRLRHLGYGMVTRPESFRVTGVQGPLVEGEVERARLWGSGLVARIVADTAERTGS
jgi:Flavodoxin